jgi:hypothetical protein
MRSDLRLPCDVLSGVGRELSIAVPHPLEFLATARRARGRSGSTRGPSAFRRDAQRPERSLSYCGKVPSRPAPPAQLATDRRNLAAVVSVGGFLSALVGATRIRGQPSAESRHLWRQPLGIAAMLSVAVSFVLWPVAIHHILTLELIFAAYSATWLVVLRTSILVSGGLLDTSSEDRLTRTVRLISILVIGAVAIGLWWIALNRLS